MFAAAQPLAGHAQAEALRDGTCAHTLVPEGCREQPRHRRRRDFRRRGGATARASAAHRRGRPTDATGTLQPTRRLANARAPPDSREAAAPPRAPRGSPGLDLQAQRDDRAPLARIHARRRQQPLQPPDLVAQRQRLRAARRTSLAACPARSRTAAARTAPWRASRSRRDAIRPPPLPLEQRLPVRFPGCRRGRPASLREGRTGWNRGRDRPQVRAGTDMRTKITHVERCYQPLPRPRR